MNKVTISVVTPTFNSAKSVKNTLNSVLAQSSSPDEYIIVDNASLDGTLDLVNSYRELFAEKNIRLKVISEKDSGIYDAINKGVRCASGDWIGIINSDDYYDELAIARLRTAIAGNHFDVFHGNISIFDSENSSIKYCPIPSAKYTMSVFHPTMFISKQSYARIGFYDLKYKLSSDFEWIMRARKSGLVFYYENQLISHYYQFGASYKNRMKGIFENYKIRKKYSIPFFITYYYLAKEIVFGPIKSSLIKILKS
jgi:glycosyltransferase involved in cell wall biosynthesis